MRNTQTKFYKKLLGASGEKAAAKYLKKLGYDIIELNYVTPYGEADIIAKDGEVLVFVEVKTRTSTNFGLPCEAVDFNKQKRYIKIAQHFLQNLKEDADVRFDIVEILSGQLNHIKNAFCA